MGKNRYHNFGLRVVREQKPLFALIVSTLSLVLIFVLPLYIPMKPLLSSSASYLAGFNNTVAIWSAACLSLAVYLWALWRQRPAPSAMPREMDAALPLSGRFVAWVIAANAIVLAACGYLVVASHMRYLGDAGYIIEQASVLRDTGRPLYTQIEFAYGLLLIWPEVWLSRMLHCGMPVAYFIALVLESSAGLLALAYVLNHVPTRGYLRRWAFVLFALAGLTPHLGLNYTYFRFASPLALLLFATRKEGIWRCALLLSAGEAIAFLISPELALVLTAGAGVFALLRARQDGLWWLVAGILPMIALAVLLRTAGRPYLQMASSFARGALSLPVGPYPHVIIFLLAVVWIVPVGAGTWLTWRSAEDARLLALFVASLAFLPAALGRCDPIHVTFNGIGIFALSLLYFRAQGRWVSYAWIVALAVLMLWGQFVNQRLFQFRTARVLALTVMPHLPAGVQSGVLRLAAFRGPNLVKAFSAQQDNSVANAKRVATLVGGADCVSTPLEVDPAIQEQLLDRRQYHPGFYAFWVDMMSPKAEQRSIQDVRQCHFLLLPDFSPGDPNTTATLTVLQGMRLPYRDRNAPLYVPGVAFRKELDDRWAEAGKVAPYTVLKQRTTEGAGADGENRDDGKKKDAAR